MRSNIRERVCVHETWGPGNASAPEHHVPRLRLGTCRSGQNCRQRELEIGPGTLARSPPPCRLGRWRVRRVASPPAQRARSRRCRGSPCVDSAGRTRDRRDIRLLHEPAQRDLLRRLGVRGGNLDDRVAHRIALCPRVGGEEEASAAAASKPGAGDLGPGRGPSR